MSKEIHELARWEQLAIARGFDQAAKTWLERGDSCEAARCVGFAQERRKLAGATTLSVVK